MTSVPFAAALTSVDCIFVQSGETQLLLQRKVIISPPSIILKQTTMMLLLDPNLEPTIPTASCSLPATEALEKLKKLSTASSAPEAWKRDAEVFDFSDAFLELTDNGEPENLWFPVISWVDQLEALPEDLHEMMVVANSKGNQLLPSAQASRGRLLRSTRFASALHMGGDHSYRSSTQFVQRRSTMMT